MTAPRARLTGDDIRALLRQAGLANQSGAKGLVEAVASTLRDDAADADAALTLDRWLEDVLRNDPGYLTSRNAAEAVLAILCGSDMPYPPANPPEIRDPVGGASP